MTLHPQKSIGCCPVRYTTAQKSHKWVPQALLLHCTLHPPGRSSSDPRVLKGYSPRDAISIAQFGNSSLYSLFGEDQFKWEKDSGYDLSTLKGQMELLTRRCCRVRIRDIIRQWDRSNGYFSYVNVDEVAHKGSCCSLALDFGKHTLRAHTSVICASRPELTWRRSEVRLQCFCSRRHGGRLWQLPVVSQLNCRRRQHFGLKDRKGQGAQTGKRKNEA